MYPNDDLEQQLQASKPISVEPPLHFRERLKSKLLSQYANQRPVSNRLRRAAMIAVPLIAVLTVGLIAWFSNTVTVSAAEIVERASQAVNGVSSFGLQSYHAVQVEWGRDYYALESMGELKIGSQQLVWVNGKKARYEFYGEVTDKIHNAIDYITVPTVVAPRTTPAPYDKGTRVVFTGLRITDGTDAWTYNVDPPGITIQSIFKPGVPKQVDPQDMPSLMAMLSRDFEHVELTGSTVIAGRDAYVLHYRPKPGMFSNPYLATVVSYIDKQAYIPLAMQYLNAKDEVLMKWEDIAFEANPQLDAKLFEFQTPSGVQVQDLRASTIPTQNDLLEAWNVANKAVSFRLYVPTNWPDNLIPEKPRVDAWKEWRDNHYQVLQSFYLRGNEHPVLEILEYVNDEKALGFGMPDQVVVNLGKTSGYTAYYAKLFDGQHGLKFIRGGTTIQLMAQPEAVDKDTLIKIAASMQPLEELGTPEPTADSATDSK